MNSHPENDQYTHLSSCMQESRFIIYERANINRDHLTSQRAIIKFYYVHYQCFRYFHLYDEYCYKVIHFTRVCCISENEVGHHVL